MIREQAAAAFGAPAGLKDAALDAWLDRFEGRGSKSFSELAAEAERSDDRVSAVAAARALHEWREKSR
jgi:hypothetical protein